MNATTFNKSDASIENMKGLIFTLKNPNYKTTKVQYARTNGNTHVFTGYIQTKRGKKNHSIMMHLTPSNDSGSISVFEGLKKYTFELNDFEIKN